MIGKTISHYKILEKLGEGGMGIVYKAEDTKLKRAVALKFLPSELTRDTEAKERFVHEARVASALQHNNICTIHAIDETPGGEPGEGQLFICMDYYKGETLKQKIEQRPLKLDDAINFAVQIAQGLAKAHEAGIVHRDIKPANIIITEDGEVKILDFGLVKLTGFTKLTKPGSTLGTTWYMSPEQLLGEKVDHRTDIWALGVVLYEMITGQVPFKGEYEQAVSYAIMNDQPEPITALRSGVPLALESIVNKAMAKDPKQRYQHMDEIPVDLANIETGSSSTSQISGRMDSRSVAQEPVIRQKVISRKISVPLLVAAMVITFIATWLLKPQSEPEPKPVSMFNHSLLSGETFNDYLAISPDGRKIVYNTTTAGVSKLYLRKIDQLKATPIANTEGAESAFFSPNSKELCFFAEDKLKKVLLDGGPAQTLCNYSSWQWGGTWGDDGMIIFATENLGLFRVSSSGGIPEIILVPDSAKNIITYGGPIMLPGSKEVLYTAWGGSADEANIAVLNLETGETETLIKGGAVHLYLPTGHILFFRSGSYWAVPFDANRLQITGQEVMVSQGEILDFGNATQIDVSTYGTLVYTTDRIWGAKGILVLVDRHGVETPLTDIERIYQMPRFSPDGTRVAVVIRDPETESADIWIHNVSRGTQIPLTSGGFEEYDHGWFPDGKRVFFSSNRSGFSNIYWKRTDGIGEAEPFFASENGRWDGTWSADGTLFAFTEGHPTTGYDIWVYKERDSSAKPFLATPNGEVGPAISPDGKWIAYNSNKSGQYQIYIKSYPGPGPEVPVSTQGGGKCVWAPDGRELFYRESDKMMVVSVETEPTLKLGIPEPLFKGSYLIVDGSAPGYDIHPDGQRFLMIKSAESKTYQINIVLNWFEMLKEKMAAAE